MWYYLTIICVHFTFPRQIYGTISLVVGITAFLTLCAFSNVSISLDSPGVWSTEGNFLLRNPTSGSVRLDSYGLLWSSSLLYEQSWSSWSSGGGKKWRCSFLGCPNDACGHYRKDKIIWECNNGGQLYSASVAAGYKTSTAFPSQFCASGFASLNTAWIIALLVDLAFQASELSISGRIYPNPSLFSCICSSLHGDTASDWNTIRTSKPLMRVRMLLMTPSSGIWMSMTQSTILDLGRPDSRTQDCNDIMTCTTSNEFRNLTTIWYYKWHCCVLG